MNGRKNRIQDSPLLFMLFSWYSLVLQLLFRNLHQPSEDKSPGPKTRCIVLRNSSVSEYHSTRTSFRVLLDMADRFLIYILVLVKQAYHYQISNVELKGSRVPSQIYDVRPGGHE